MPLVQATSSNALTSSPGSMSFVSTPGVGNAVFVAWQFDDNFAPGSVTSIVDNQSGNTFTRVVATNDEIGGDNSRTELWWCPALTAASGTYTVTATYTGTGNLILRLMEYSGLLGVVDQTGVANGAVSSLTVTASAPNAHAKDLVIALMSLGGYKTPSGITSPANTGYSSWGLYDGGVAKQASYKVVTATETSSANWAWTTSGATAAVIATFPYALPNLAATATDITSAVGAITTAVQLAAAAADATSAAATLTNYATVTLAGTLYTGTGGLFDPNGAAWSAGAPIVGSVIYYDNTIATVETDAEIVAISNNFSFLAQFYNGSTWSNRLFTITPYMVAYAADANSATGTLNTAAAVLAGAAASLTTATASLTARAQLIASALDSNASVGGITVRSQLAGAATDTEGATGTLSSTRVAASAQDTTSAIGLLTVSAALSSAALDSNNAQATLKVQVQLLSAALNANIAHGQLSGVSLSGAATSTNTAQGLLTARVALAAAAADLTSAIARVTVKASLVAAAIDATSAHAIFSPGGALFSAAQDTTTAQASLMTMALLESAAQDLTAAMATLRVQVPLLGIALDTSVASATFAPLQMFGYATVVPLSQSGFQGARSAYPQNSASTVLTKFFSSLAQLMIPQSVQYRLDDLVSGQQILNWTPISPASSLQVTITTTQNAMISNSRASETHQILFMIEDGFGNVSYQYGVWDIVRVTPVLN